MADPFEAQNMINNNLGLVIFQLGLLSAIVKLAIDNVKATIDGFTSGKYWPIVGMVALLIFCAAYEWDIVNIIMNAKAPKAILGLNVAQFLGMLITAMAAAGGAGALKDALKKAGQRRDNKANGV